MKTNRTNDYKDLDLDFLMHPVTKDVVRLVGPAAVARSIKNLILTNFYDRPFRSNIGSNVQRSLFEPMTPLTMRNLERFIADVIRNFEPRAQLIGVQAFDDGDNNGYSVKISFMVENRPEPYELTTFLERVR